MYDLYGNKTIHKLAELFMLSLYVHQKTQFGVSLDTWGHCERVTLRIGVGKGDEFTDGKIFKSDLNMRKQRTPRYNKLEKMKFSLSMAALRYCIKENKVTIKLAQSMDRLNKKMEAKREWTI